MYAEFVIDNKNVNDLYLLIQIELNGMYNGKHVEGRGKLEGRSFLLLTYRSQESWKLSVSEAGAFI